MYWIIPIDATFPVGDGVLQSCLLPPKLPLPHPHCIHRHGPHYHAGTAESLFSQTCRDLEEGKRSTPTSIKAGRNPASVVPHQVIPTLLQ